MFVPANDPARNIWYWRDIDAMAATLGADAPRVHRYVIDAEADPAGARAAGRRAASPASSCRTGISSTR